MLFSSLSDHRLQEIIRLERLPQNMLYPSSDLICCALPSSSSSSSSPSSSPSLGSVLSSSTLLSPWSSLSGDKLNQSAVPCRQISSTKTYLPIKADPDSEMGQFLHKIKIMDSAMQKKHAWQISRLVVTCFGELLLMISICLYNCLCLFMFGCLPCARDITISKKPGKVTHFTCKV